MAAGIDGKAAKEPRCRMNQEETRQMVPECRMNQEETKQMVPECRMNQEETKQMVPECRMNQEEIERMVPEILKREWKMFTNVSNEGGRAACQDDRKTFDIMRKSQFAVWNGEALLSYLNDLKQAELAGRNLMTEKYGYMMEDTAPEEFKRIRELLPAVTAEKAQLAAELTEIQVKWMERFREQYPGFKKRGRPLRKTDAVSGLDTSLETYARGELLTYSLETLNLLKRHFRQLDRQEMNLGTLVMEATVRQYGYQSVEDAQDHLK
ncbi:DUF4125 family protein [Clostridium sp. MCC353]|uniref:DUF4125 family protein n=1 Tax=Clostridium sp. MCC353 TaxID=2592646 RepID=UPI001C02EA8E|nr:DUF4125 family protein [Clostridium sp. MCC353]MBT9775474.1 DUF4125 family protein [Clostridium sp. MCC353]